jgi:hypothetical protein
LAAGQPVLSGTFRRVDKWRAGHGRSKDEIDEIPETKLSEETYIG